jgi:glycosyltransferase involved in cell wall biosynthesis
LKEKLSSLPRLYLVGEAPSQSARELLDQLQLGDVVHILGPKEPEALAELYQQALCFALSSDEEGLGIVILEAMASGLPVVSTACGGPTSSVVDGTTGFLTPVGDAVALADALQRLIEDPDLARGMGEAGRIRAEKNFSLQVSGRPFLTAYDNTFDRTRIDKRISRWDGSDLVGERSTLETNPFVKR